MNLRFKKSIFCTGVLIALLCGCSRTSPETSSKSTVFVAPSQWMMQSFKEPLTINDQNDLSKAISAPWYAQFSVIREKDSSELIIASCGQLFLENNSKLFAARESEASAFMSQVAMCLAVNILKNAKPAVAQHIKDPLIKELTPDRLPKELAYTTSTVEDDAINKDVSIQHWGDVNKDLVVTFVSDYQSKFTNSEMQQVVDILGRGDFDGDGIEDILISIKSSALGGSFSNDRIFALKNVTGGRWELVFEAN